MISPLIVTCVGLLAQCFFSARTLVQWVMSERARRVLSPTAFWACSVAGSALLAAYGWLRLDLAVVAGQSVSYYVYVWNLHIKHVRMPRVAWALLIMFPLVAMGFLLTDPASFERDFLARPDLPLGLLLFGAVGQLTMTLRFIYQWLYSRRRGESELPPLFWWLSLTGATLILIYGIIRSDIVLILGQGFGLIVYLRNIIIGVRS